jgi:hypothetical protein
VLPVAPSARDRDRFAAIARGDVVIYILVGQKGEEEVGTAAGAFAAPTLDTCPAHRALPRFLDDSCDL